MFDVDGMTVSLTIGDTGAFKIRATGYELQDDDAVLFTVKNATGTVMIERFYTNKLIDGEPVQGRAGGIEEDNSILVCLHNGDTEKYPAGNYNWDVRYIINAYYDENNIIADGDQVITPYPPQQFILTSPVGTV